MTERKTLMSASDLTKRFGGLAAVNDVSLALWHGHIHAVIGPNGAGKSTLANLLSGDLPPTSGRITLSGTDVTGWTPEKISRNGLGRSYQKTNIFSTFTVWDNVRLAAQSRAQPSPINPLGCSKLRQPCKRAPKAPNAPSNWPGCKTALTSKRAPPATASNAIWKSP